MCDSHYIEKGQTIHRIDVKDGQVYIDVFFHGQKVHRMSVCGRADKLRDYLNQRLEDERL